jgi:hypothetical protein
MLAGLPKQEQVNAVVLIIHIAVCNGPFWIRTVAGWL